MNQQEQTQPTTPELKNWGSERHIQILVLIVATSLGLYVCYLLTVTFLPPITWALAIAVLFTPFHHRLESRLHHPNLTATISVLMIILIVVVPVLFVGQQLVQQTSKGAELIQSKIESGEWRRTIEKQPRLAPLLDKFEHMIDLKGTLKTITSWLGTAGGSIVKGSIFQAINLLMMFYLLFFFLRDHRVAIKAIRSLSPLTKTEMDQMLSRVRDTIFAIMYGTLTVSSLQGLLGGLMFWWLGLPAPLLWGVVMAILAVVPVLGAFLVWLPAVFFLALEGSWGKAIILLLWGMIVVGTVDNLLRPVLVGNKLKLHTVLAFLSVVGGLVLFGMSGLILGPVALTITTVLLEIASKRTTTAEIAQHVGAGDLSHFENKSQSSISSTLPA